MKMIVRNVQDQNNNIVIKTFLKPMGVGRGATATQGLTGGGEMGYTGIQGLTGGGERGYRSPRTD